MKQRIVLCKVNGRVYQEDVTVMNTDLSNYGVYKYIGQHMAK